MAEPRRYRTYLLRLWLAEGEDGLPVWLASLESAQTGERCGFADLGSLFAFLEQQTTSNSEHGSRPPAAEA